MTILYTSKKKAPAAFTSASLLHTLHNPNAYGTSANDYFGWAVAISGNLAVIGARYEDDAGGTDSGKVYLYNLN